MTVTKWLSSREYPLITSELCKKLFSLSSKQLLNVFVRILLRTLYCNLEECMYLDGHV